MLEETLPAYSSRGFILEISAFDASFKGTASYGKMRAVVGFLAELRLRLKV